MAHFIYSHLPRRARPFTMLTLRISFVTVLISAMILSAYSAAVLPSATPIPTMSPKGLKIKKGKCTKPSLSNCQSAIECCRRTNSPRVCIHCTQACIGFDHSYCTYIVDHAKYCPRRTLKVKSGRGLPSREPTVTATPSPSYNKMSINFIITTIVSGVFNIYARKLYTNIFIQEEMTDKEFWDYICPPNPPKRDGGWCAVPALPNRFPDGGSSALFPIPR